MADIPDPIYEAILQGVAEWLEENNTALRIVRHTTEDGLVALTLTTPDDSRPHITIEVAPDALRVINYQPCYRDPYEDAVRRLVFYDDPDWLEQVDQAIGELIRL